jgi:hypothetical protein
MNNTRQQLETIRQDFLTMKKELTSLSFGLFLATSLLLGVLGMCTVHQSNIQLVQQTNSAEELSKANHTAILGYSAAFLLALLVSSPLSFLFSRGVYRLGVAISEKDYNQQVLSILQS